ncbi:hypothetical protein XENOCAPTIV_020818 [Xenoophorus captivus]|uniref:Uncharacterized protein n=1 Tax=Xenoophorus captivus TaxID=1517983 RepID=A0ABV0S417_9TELE
MPGWKDISNEFTEAIYAANQSGKAYEAISEYSMMMHPAHKNRSRELDKISAIFRAYFLKSVWHGRCPLSFALAKLHLKEPKNSWNNFLSIDETKIEINIKN